MVVEFAAQVPTCRRYPRLPLVPLRMVRSPSSYQQRRSQPFGTGQQRICIGSARLRSPPSCKADAEGHDEWRG